MKTRTKFVSNSSSASFIIETKWLTQEQIDKIVEHDIYGEQMGIPYANSDQWDVYVTDTALCGETWMDNFDMKEFMEKIGVPMDKVQWSEMLLFDDFLNIPSLQDKLE